LPEFIPAAELKKIYGIYGHFYSVDLAAGDRIHCRSVLEILSKESLPSEINLVSNKKPDAVVIMMNPGSSKPLEEVNNIISEKQISQLKSSLVLTRPDTTQYQVMRLMFYCQWSHVRVLNISDLRDPKSTKFIAHFSDIERRTGFLAHSLFSDPRRAELKTKLNRQTNAPILFAWGVSPDLDPLIERCLKRVGNLPGTIGLLKPHTKNKYFHPLPTLQRDKLKWVNQMICQIKATQ
jgi:hypothetical protein